MVRGSLVVVIFEGGREANTVVGLEGNGVAGTLLLPCVWARVVFVAVTGDAVAVTAFHSTVALAFVRGVLATVVTVTVALDAVAVDNTFVRSVLGRNFLVLDIGTVACGGLVLGACNGSLLRLRLVDGVPLIGGRATHGILDIVYNTSRCYCMDVMCDILYYTD